MIARIAAATQATILIHDGTSYPSIVTVQPRITRTRCVIATKTNMTLATSVNGFMTHPQVSTSAVACLWFGSNVPVKLRAAAQDQPQPLYIASSTPSDDHRRRRRASAPT